MSVDLSVENKLNLWLLLGTINHTIFLAVVYFGFIVSDFKFHGDSFGGVMMAYALSIFFPQLFFEAFVIAAVIITSIIYVMKSELIETNYKLVISFLSTFIFAIITSCII